MTDIFLKIILTALVVGAAAYVLPGVEIAGPWTAVIVGLALGVINALVRPLVLLITLPINLLTLGLFTLVVNAMMVMLTAAVVPGFAVSGFWTALLFSIIVWALNLLLRRHA